MMFLLIANVSRRVIRLRNPYAEGAVTGLPGKVLMFGKRVVNPLGRTTLQQLHCFRNVYRRW